MPGSDDARGANNADSALDEARERTEIARSQRGDRAAFNELVIRYQTAAYGLALRMLGDPDTAADVTQDAFFAAYRNIRSLRGMSFRAWLLRIVSNGCYDYWRAQRRRPAESLDALLAGGDDVTWQGGYGAADPALAQALADPAWEPERAALRAEQIAAIEAAVLRLAPDQRLVIILSDIQGLSYEEIARVAEIPLGTVKSRIARARARLREALLGEAGQASQASQAELFPHAQRHEISENQ